MSTPNPIFELRRERTKQSTIPTAKWGKRFVEPGEDADAALARLWKVEQNASNLAWLAEQSGDREGMRRCAVVCANALLPMLGGDQYGAAERLVMRIRAVVDCTDPGDHLVDDAAALCATVGPADNAPHSAKRKALAAQQEAASVLRMVANHLRPEQTTSPAMWALRPPVTLAATALATREKGAKASTAKSTAAALAELADPIRDALRAPPSFATLNAHHAARLEVSG